MTDTRVYDIFSQRGIIVQPRCITIHHIPCNHENPSKTCTNNGVLEDSNIDLSNWKSETAKVCRWTDGDVRFTCDDTTRDTELCRRHLSRRHMWSLQVPLSRGHVVVIHFANFDRFPLTMISVSMTSRRYKSGRSNKIVRGILKVYIDDMSSG